MKLSEIVQLSNPLEFLKELRTAVTALKGGDPAVSAHWKWLTTMVRCYYVHVLGGDFGTFLTDASCGAAVEDLKRCLAELHCERQVAFIAKFECEFPEGVVPSDPIERLEALEAIETKLGNAWLLDLTATQKAFAVEVVDALRRYVAHNANEFLKG